MIICGTGHRPPKLGGYSIDITNKVLNFAISILKDIKPDEIISGMALGWDQALAEAAAHLGIPFIAAVPFDNQDKMWPKPSKDQFRLLLSMAKEVVVVEPGPYAPWKMQRRNTWMVNNSQKVIALWNGSPGGTKNCINCAILRDIPVINVWDKYIKIGE